MRLRGLLPHPSIEVERMWAGSLSKSGEFRKKTKRLTAPQ